MISDSTSFCFEIPQRKLWYVQNKTKVRTLAGSIVAYVNSSLVFSIASLFSIPISHAMPNGSAGDGVRVSLRMGMRALGRGLTSKLVSCDISYPCHPESDTVHSGSFLLKTPTCIRREQDEPFAADHQSSAPSDCFPNQLTGRRSGQPGPCLRHQCKVSGPRGYQELDALVEIGIPEFRRPNEF